MRKREPIPRRIFSSLAFTCCFCCNLVYENCRSSVLVAPGHSRTGQALVTVLSPRLTDVWQTSAPQFWHVRVARYLQLTYLGQRSIRNGSVSDRLRGRPFCLSTCSVPSCRYRATVSARKSERSQRPLQWRPNRLYYAHDRARRRRNRPARQGGRKSGVPRGLSPCRRERVGNGFHPADGCVVVASSTSACNWALIGRQERTVQQVRHRDTCQARLRPL